MMQDQQPFRTCPPELVTCSHSLAMRSLRLYCAHSLAASACDKHFCTAAVVEHSTPAGACCYFRVVCLSVTILVTISGTPGQKFFKFGKNIHLYLGLTDYILEFKGQGQSDWSGCGPENKEMDL